MGGTVEHDFEVQHWRKGVAGYEVMASSTNLSIARAAFWGAVEAKGASLFAGDEILLRHGARVILQYPPDLARNGFAVR